MIIKQFNFFIHKSGIPAVLFSLASPFPFPPLPKKKKKKYIELYLNIMSLLSVCEIETFLVGLIVKEKDEETRGNEDIRSPHGGSD